MAYSDFTFPEVTATLALSVREADLYATVPPLPLAEETLRRIRDGANLALAINTEKSRSEFIIAPLLFELRMLLGGTFGLFSGTELDADAERGLNGFCDFILTRDARQFVLTPPLVAIFEAKNDNLRNGLGQCIAAMVAAGLLNERAGTPCAVHGVVTTGSAWKFLRLEGGALTLDVPEYFIDSPGKIMGILRQLVQPVAAT